MADFKLGDMVLYRAKGGNKDVWRPSVYVGIGKDGRLYFSDGGCLIPPENFEIVLLNEDTLQYLGSSEAIKIPWKPKRGELVAVKDKGDAYWKSLVFIKMTPDGRYKCCWHEDANDDEPVPWDYCEPLHKHFNVPSDPDNE